MTPDFDRSDKRALINLRQQIEASYDEAFYLLSEAGKEWFTGRRRVLEHARRILASRGIETRVALQFERTEAMKIEGKSGGGMRCGRN